MTKRENNNTSKEVTNDDIIFNQAVEDDGSEFINLTEVFVESGGELSEHTSNRLSTLLDDVFSTSEVEHIEPSKTEAFGVSGSHNLTNFITKTLTDVEPDPRLTRTKSLLEQVMGETTRNRTTDKTSNEIHEEIEEDYTTIAQIRYIMGKYKESEQLGAIKFVLDREKPKSV